MSNHFGRKFVYANLNWENEKQKPKKILKNIFLAVEKGYTVASCSGVCFAFWSQVC